jgi:glycosyltransferase involved in cell wall biosynthesis
MNLYGWNRDLSIPVSTGKDMVGNDLLISIVIPTLNQAGTIEDTLLSIINQDYCHYEIIVIDGGSRDRTLEVLKEYQECIKYCVSEKDKGQSSAINKGFRLASGDVFAWLNSDDYYLPNIFGKVKQQFMDHPESDIVVGSGTIISRDSLFLKDIHAMEMTRDNLLDWENDRWIMQQSCFWRRELWERSGGVDEDLNLLMDLDLWFRFSELGNSLVINEPLATMRYYPDAKTVRDKEKIWEEKAYVYAKHAAYPQLRKMINSLYVKNQTLERKIQEQDRRITTRFLKRLGIYK